MNRVKFLTAKSAEERSRLGLPHIILLVASEEQAAQNSSNFSENAHVRDRWNAITAGGMMASTHETRMRSRAVSQVKGSSGSYIGPV